MSSKLLLRFVKMGQPLLVQPDDMDLYMDALCESNMMEAWIYQRKFPEDVKHDGTRTRLLRRILDFCLLGNSLTFLPYSILNCTWNRQSSPYSPQSPGRLSLLFFRRSIGHLIRSETTTTTNSWCTFRVARANHCPANSPRSIHRDHPT